MFSHGSPAIALPAIFLAFANQEIKQAGRRLPLAPAMTSPENPREEIDPAVIRRVAGGDAAAFEQVYDAFSGLLYALALRMLQKPEDAEELLQEVFTKIWKEAASYDSGRGAPLAWAITITRHKAIDRIRSTTRRLRLNDEAGAEAAVLPASPTQPAHAAEQAENARAVRGSLDALPSDVRETIELAYFGGLSQSQIAEKLSLPLTTVKSRIRRAMMQLRQTLQQYL